VLVPQIYTVVTGDTLASIAGRLYGDDTKANLLAAANGVSEDDLQVGQMLVVPQQ